MKKKWKTALISLLIIGIGIFVYLYFFNSETAPMLAGKNSEVKETKTTEEKPEKAKEGSEAKPVVSDNITEKEKATEPTKAEKDEKTEQKPEIDQKAIYLVYGLDKAATKWDNKIQTDLVITATLDPASNSIDILFIPPNTAVNNKELKNIYSEENIDNLLIGVEKITNKDIDDYIGLDYKSFVDLIDTIGKIEVEVNEDIHLRKYGLTLDKGLNELDGQETLKLIRLRRPDTTVMERIERQKRIATAIYKELKDFGNLSELKEVSDSLLKLREELETNVSSDQIIKGFRFFNRGVDKINVEVLSGHTKEGLWIPSNNN
mgnify:FL=1